MGIITKVLHYTTLSIHMFSEKVITNFFDFVYWNVSWWGRTTLAEWLTDEEHYVFFQAEITARDFHHCKSSTSREQDLKLRRSWGQTFADEVVQWWQSPYHGPIKPSHHDARLDDDRKSLLDTYKVFDIASDMIMNRCIQNAAKHLERSSYLFLKNYLELKVCFRLNP